MSGVWTNENIANLMRFVAEGMTAGAISLALRNEFSRNAVIGKCHRLEIQLAHKPISEAFRGARKKRESPRKARSHHKSSSVKKIIQEPVSAPEMRLITLVQLRPTTCRWPIGDPKMEDFRYCGANGASMTGCQPYCPYHRGLAYETPQQRLAARRARTARQQVRAF